MPDAPVTTPADPPIAHSAPEGGTEQTLVEHARNVAGLAASFAKPFDGEPMATWLGWWHDAGKACPEIQAYLRGEGKSKDHSSAGMLKGMDAATPAPAVCVAGHHGGLSNVTGPAPSLEKRARKASENDRIVAALRLGESWLRPHATGDVNHVPRLDGPPEERCRQLEMWTRFVHSALVDADYLDTEEHFQPGMAALRTISHDMAALLRDLETNQQERFGPPETDINRVRDEVYRTALEAASQPRGLFTMAVPTGGGKTRSAMAFALRHADEHQLKRVIVALPYTTIIEQNAKEYRKIFGSRYVLEHHSSVRRSRRAKDAPNEAERKEVLAAENWDVPIVVTTMVQLLETLFSNRCSRLRKLHRYARSVIVLDEVQTIPPHLVEPTMWALRELTRRYGASVVLSTATQPDYGPVGHYPATPIIHDPDALYRRMRRVRYDVQIDQPWSVDRVAEEMYTARQALTICNTTDDAERVARSAGALYLSTRLCSAHRESVLDAICDALENEEPIYVAATQVVEAGVDISFPLVLRDAGPLDGMIQAAGRCNRNREQETGRVIIFRLLDGSCPPPPYRTGRDIALGLLRDGIDLHTPEASRRYFDELYSDFPTDKNGVQKLRAEFAFERVADAYCLIDDDRVPVVVDYEDAFDVLASVEKAAGRLGYVHPDHWHRLQPYTVSVPAYLHEKALDFGLVTEVATGLWRWASKWYDKAYGLQVGEMSPSDGIW
jgi:CRISPR-associated endonuclease/helicase Cas3